MSKYNLSFFAFLTLLTSGCSQDDSFELSNKKEIPDYSCRISNLIEDVYKKVHKETRSNLNQFCITDVSTKTYLIPDSIITRSESPNENTYDIHTVTVDFGESTGYVILSDTPGIEHVFCYTET